ncbi:MAG: SWIM zinc finger family protein [Chloroflexi bacterium]|nr:SWIM zinc finger family protein [Chloroflexota bacterium]
MGRWQDYEWDYYSESTPRRVEGGIKTKSERGVIGETWWSKRWVHVLESLGMGARLTRGRSYARQGQVLSIDIEPGRVKAKVQGSMVKPYNIEIRLQPLSDKEWDKVTEAMASQAIFAAKLLAGEMPTNIEEAFGAVHLSLFPTTEKDLLTKCSCPDWANPCKHIAAVYYILAERFDGDPFLIFKLRGRTKEEIIEILRNKRASTLPAESRQALSATGDTEETTDDTSLRLEDYLETFWQAGDALDTFVIHPQNPEVDKAVLKRLGNAPFSIADQNLTALLAKAYDEIEAAASRKAAEELQ